MAINWAEIEKRALEKAGKPQPTTTTTSNPPKKVPPIKEAPLGFQGKTMTPTSTSSGPINWDRIEKGALARKKAYEETPPVPAHIGGEEIKKERSYASRALDVAKTVVKEVAKKMVPSYDIIDKALIVRKSKQEKDKASSIMPDTLVTGEGEQFQITQEDVDRNPNLKPIFDEMQKKTTVSVGPTVRDSELLKKGIKADIIPASSPTQTLTTSLKDQASLEIKSSSTTQVLSDAPLTTKGKALANELKDFLQLAELQYKSGPRGKIEAVKGLTRGILEQGNQILRAGNTLVNFTNPITWFSAVREKRREMYDTVDSQIAKITPKENYEQVFQTTKFVGDQLPYVASDAVIIKAFKTLPLALRTSKMAQEAAEAASWVATGQILHKEEDGSRAQQALLDTAFYLGFRAVGLSGLGLKGVVEEQLAKESTKKLKTLLSDSANQVLKKLENGDKVLVDEVELLNKELAEIETPGTLNINKTPVETNSQNELGNFIVNERKTHYSVDPNSTGVKVTFPTDAQAGVRITAPTIDELTKVANDFGQKFDVPTQRKIIDFFMPLIGKDFDLNELTKALVSYAVNKSGKTATYNTIQTMVNDLLDSIPSEINAIRNSRTGIGNGLSGIPSRAYKQIVNESIDGALKEIAPKLDEFIRNSAKQAEIQIKDVPVVKETPKTEIEAQGVKTPSKEAIISETTETIDDSLKAQGVTATSQKAIEPVVQNIEGKAVKKSKLYERIQQSIEEEFKNDGIKYTQMDIDENTQRAIDVVQSRSANDILKVVRGFSPSIDGVTDLRLGVALFHKAIAEGNTELAAQAIQSVSRRATRTGQEIASLVGAFNDNSPASLVKEVLNRRIQSVRQKLSRAVKKIAKESGDESFDVIAHEAKNLNEVIIRKASKIESAQAILNRLTCK